MTISTVTYAIDMADWSARVCYRMKCTYPGCTSKYGLGGHHIIPRAVPATRLMVENGVCLCTEHHGEVEEEKGKASYDRIMSILVGRKRYEMLLNLAKAYEKSRDTMPTQEMPTSDFPEMI